MRDAVFLVERAGPVTQRIAVAFVNVVLASAVLVSAVVVGHELRGWREWYPNVRHPWLEPPAEVVEP